jgi:hypothetical protein
MAMAPIRSLTIIVLFLFLTTIAQGQAQIVLLDRSGSMKPYYENGLVATLNETISRVMRDQSTHPSTLAAFNNHVEIVSRLSDISVTGPTHLDAAIDYAISHDYSLVWLVTDNIMHRVGEEEGQTRDFYERLKADVVRRVVVFPLRQKPGTNTAGIIVYALLLSSSEGDLFKRQTEDFAHRRKETVLLPMKPLDRDTIETLFAETGKSQKPKTVYSDGSVIKETMELRFKSKFEHLTIQDADIINPRVAPEFSENSLLDFEKDEVTITPTKISELGPHNETVQKYKVDVDLGRIRLRRDFKSLWRAALRNPNEEIYLDLSFSIRVPKENFQFTEAFRTTYSAETTDQAKTEGKIFALDQLPLLVAENQTAIDVPHKPKLQVRYPSWLFLIFPGIPIVVAALLIGVFILALRMVTRATKKRFKWTVEVQSPAQGKGKLQGRWVVVNFDGRQNRLGQFKGESFVPATGVSPRERQTIKDGFPVSLTFRKQDYTIIFRRSSSNGTTKAVGKGKPKNGKRIEVKI